MRIILFLSFLCVGCSENHIKKNNRLTKKEISADVSEICDRIKRLNMTAVTLGSGVNSRTACFLKKCGINIPDSALINNDVFGSADTDDHRLNNFLDAINSDHKIIWAVRGGFGSARLAESLNRLPNPRIAKTFVGFCDVTSVNLFIAQKWPNWRIIHGTVLTYLGEKLPKNKFNVLLDILENKITSYSMSNLSPLNEKARTEKNVAGKLTGGNLTIIENSLKTCWEIQTNGKIVFIEDVHEEAEHIYRMMHHLKEAGKFSGAKAVVFGYFHKASDQERVLLHLKGFAQTLDIPVYVTDQFGHGDHNLPLIYNASATIHDGKMTITDPSANRQQI